jgi:hypothetical protein
MAFIATTTSTTVGRFPILIITVKQAQPKIGALAAKASA